MLVILLAEVSPDLNPLDFLRHLKSRVYVKNPNNLNLRDCIPTPNVTISSGVINI